MDKKAEIEKLEKELEDKGFEPELLEALNEWELFRLQENCEAKNSIIQVTVALSLESFDTDLPEIFRETKSFGEIITTLPDPDGDQDQICFNLVYAGKDDMIVRLNEFFAGKSYKKEIKNLP
ncbi:MAG: hypothetical protein NT116_02235 [Candidatus Parcubacteria bacterium]|nr:hypothetical protein [Candidatus Parcubacteria bacterium]